MYFDPEDNTPIGEMIIADFNVDQELISLKN